MKKIRLFKKQNLKYKRQFQKNQTLNVGDFVYVEDSNNAGQIIEIIDKNVVVDFNGIKIKTKLKKLVKTEDTPKEKPEYKDNEFKFGEVSKLDIRGMRAEEAVKLLDKTLSESITSNIPEISVIHGKGTGALRTAIREFIQYHHLVKSFREGTLVEGGSGVTIIEI